MPKKKIAIIGATGYTGSELVRILTHHPEADISLITSESRAGERFSDVHPFFQGIADQKLHKAEAVKDHDIDLAFLALPHGVSMKYVEQFANQNFKIVDLSGDFRLPDPETYESWYNKDHTYREGFAKAVYGLPELNAEKIKTAELVANPGCYPTSALLGLAPLVNGKLIDPASIVVDSKSGVTGAGVKAKAVNHFSTVNDNFKAYGLKKHRHTIEIQTTLAGVFAAKPIVQFTPHLLPLDRGILSTIYAKPAKDVSEELLMAAYGTFYGNAPFVRLRKQGPTLKDVRGTNYCDIYCTFDERTRNIIVISVIDNLVKGAAGQAVQNMNLMFGMEEDLGLRQIPLAP
ncbi:MAG: N-acetyl-gamma-glutamyl-phosphate reductase [Saprospiraceae bacterium]|nr:N-acetyl-gamma-glutamyl-phosphate reductase [Saprospiraceae bacterium]